MKSHKTPTLIISQRIEDYNREYEKKKQQCKGEKRFNSVDPMRLLLALQTSFDEVFSEYKCMYTHTHIAMQHK